MLRLKRVWTGRVRMLAVVGLLALIGVSCTGGVREEELAELQAPVGERVALASGIALTYEHDGETGLVTYPVNSTYVYDFYGEFESAWKDRPGIIVELAWIGGDDEGTWQLYFFNRELVRGDSVIELSDVTLTQWHEYLVYTQAGNSTGTDAVPSSVLIDRSRQQSIVESIEVGDVVTGTAAVSGPSITDLGEMQNGRRFVRFLVTEKYSGEHTLVTVLGSLCDLPGATCGEFQPPDDVDAPGQQNCTNCVWGICVACWW